MLRIYYTNLALYNEGTLSGEWLDLPATQKEISDLMDRTGYDETHEEYFITDFESDIDNLHICEYADLDELNELAELIETDPVKVEALLYFGYSDNESISEKLDDISYICTPKGSESNEFAVGWYYAKECGCIDIPESVEPYFDFEAYGRDIMLEGQFYTATNGDIYELM